MKTRNIFISIFFFVVILLIGITVPGLSYDYFVESLQSIIKRSTDIVEAEVVDIAQTTDEHNTPVRTVTLKVNEIIVERRLIQLLRCNFLFLIMKVSIGLLLQSSRPVKKRSFISRNLLAIHMQ